ncbi:MAG: hypothetical protein Q4D56_07975 [Bacteroides sp.]|nr:hypothetical protein [Bacteroides sp.]
MRKDFNLFVEGIADKRFFEQYLEFLFNTKIDSQRVIGCKGYTNLGTEAKDGIALRNQMIQMTNNDGVNLVIFDADKDKEKRSEEILAWKTRYNLKFELFLLPNNKDQGALEDLLEQIINPVNRPIFDCWEHYEQELKTTEIEGRTPPPLTTPAKKTKIYGYLEALLGESKKEKDMIKEKERDYTCEKHWNLQSEYLEGLKSFLLKYLKTEEKL